MSADVEHFIASHSLHKPTLVGHSMGAKVAMTMALRRPTHYSGICPVDNSPIDAALKSDFGTYVAAMREVEEKRPGRQSDADAILKKHNIELPIRQFLLTNYIRRPDNSYAFRVPLATLAKSLPAMADFPYRDPEEARFEGPTLFVRGTESHYVADETLPLIGRFFPRFELLSLDCGHWVMSERFEEFRTGFGEWVARCVDERDEG
jgi:pimeloyl-ACP methyl ester carboxylesterase